MRRGKRRKGKEREEERQGKRYRTRQGRGKEGQKAKKETSLSRGNVVNRSRSRQFLNVETTR